MRYVVGELKADGSQFEYAGKLGFYAALVDDKLRLEKLCADCQNPHLWQPNDHTVHYPPARSTSLLAVSTYTYDPLPIEEKNALPDAEQLAPALDWPVREDPKLVEKFLLRLCRGSACGARGRTLVRTAVLRLESHSRRNDPGSQPERRGGEHSRALGRTSP